MSTPKFGLTFDELREANDARAVEVFIDCEEWSASDWATALAGEVGELCNLIKKVRRGDHIERKAIEDEIADVQTYLDLLARYFGIDLAQVTRRKFNEVSEKRHSQVRL